MILVDYSSILHRKIHTAVKQTNPKTTDGQYNTSEYVDYVKHCIMEELIEIQTTYSGKFGDLVICLDNATGGYWRRDFYPGYKMQRKDTRDQSPINFKELFAELQGLIEAIRNFTPWKVVEVEKAEADDLILVLSDLYNKHEPILIHSPDKDMLQAAKPGANVKQWSSLTHKWLTPESKSGSLQEWIDEHCILGDFSDGVPKIVHGTEFSEDFLTYLKEHGHDCKTPQLFKTSIPKDEKIGLLNEFSVYETNRNGESTGVKAIYKPIRFGPSGLKKVIKEHGSVENWLKTDKTLQENYDRNYILVMREGIPEYIEENVLTAYNEAKTEYKNQELEEYLRANNMNMILTTLPIVFKLDREITASDFGW